MTAQSKVSFLLAELTEVKSYKLVTEYGFLT
jgi:hypothetical protein